MRLFQNFGISPSYRRHYLGLSRHAAGFHEKLDIFLNDRYGASHILDPVYGTGSRAFFTLGDDETLQKTWARAHGMPASSSGEDILVAQIEAHRTEVFYNIDPLRFGNKFLRRLPGSVRHTLAWRAAPSGGADLSGYDKIVCNFPSILADYRQRGCREIGRAHV